MKLSIQKYYCDLQTTDGQIFIGYTGSLELGPLKIPYGAKIINHPQTGSKSFPAHGSKDQDQEQVSIQANHPSALTTQSWAAGQVTESQNFTCHHPALGFTGGWARSDNGPIGLFHQSPEGSISWQVKSLAQPAEVKLAGAATLYGLGYWEVLNMTLPPWRLPFSILKWGRFIADDGATALVWVGWLGGAVEQQKVWLKQGALSYQHKPELMNACPNLMDPKSSQYGELTEPVFSDNSLKCQEGVLDFLAPQTIRQGELFKTLGGKLAGLARVFPRKLGLAREEKWLSRARWSSGSSGPQEGWAIYETVYWQGV